MSARAANDDIHAADFRPRSPAEALEPSRAPEPPEYRERRRIHPIISILNGLMTLMVVGLIGLGAFIYFVKIRFDEPGPLQHSTVVVIPKGEGVNAIAERLEREGIISDRRIFVASVIYFNSQDKLKAGEYEVRKHASMRDVLDQLVRGKSILYKVTIPEGLTSQQAVERLMQAEHLTGEITRIPEEGSLLPDTYKYSRGMTRQEVIERMQAEQRKFLDALWEKRDPDLPFKTKKEAITLASIVEKETSRADERARIAGVFINRLRKGMKLQS
ncbi:MAG: aminodeoxychorismate lyase, partial [Alphaproteobacteria bacterium]